MCPMCAPQPLPTPLTSRAPGQHRRPMPTPIAGTVDRSMPKTAPIMVRPSLSIPQKKRNPAEGWAPQGSALRPRRRAYSRAPSNEFCPRGCNNCGLSFVPRGFGGDFCSGECRHSFAFMRHLEKRRQQQQLAKKG